MGTTMPSAGRRMRARIVRRAAISALLVAVTASAAVGTAEAAEPVAPAPASPSGQPDDPFTDDRTTKWVEVVDVDDRLVDRDHPIGRCTQQTPRNGCQISQTLEVASEVRGELGLEAGALAASFGISQTQSYAVSARCDFAVAEVGQRYAAFPGLTEYRYYVFAEEPSGVMGSLNYAFDDYLDNLDNPDYKPSLGGHIGSTTRSELRTQHVYNGDVSCEKA